MHNFYKVSDTNPALQELSGVFLDISTSFDKIWHDGLIFKLKLVGFQILLCLIESFLSNRSQRVLLNGKMLEWLQVKAGVP